MKEARWTAIDFLIGTKLSYKQDHVPNRLLEEPNCELTIDAYSLRCVFHFQVRDVTSTTEARDG